MTNQQKERKGFIFNYSWIDMLEGESDEVKIEALNAIMAYATKKEKIKPSKDFRMAYKIIVKDIDYNEASYQRTVENKKHASNVRWDKGLTEKTDAETSSAMQSNAEDTSAYHCNALNAEDADRIDRTNKIETKRSDKEKESVREKEDVSTSSRAQEKKPYINPILENEVIDSDSFRDFRAWQKDFTPSTLKLKNFTNLITEKEFWHLIDLVDPSGVNGDDALEKIKKELLQIENRHDLQKKYKSLYRTVINWLKKDGLIKEDDVKVEDYQA